MDIHNKDIAIEPVIMISVIGDHCSLVCSRLALKKQKGSRSFEFMCELFHERLDHSSGKILRCSRCFVEEDNVLNK